jgi:hypothetical protein
VSECEWTNSVVMLQAFLSSFKHFEFHIAPKHNVMLKALFFFLTNAVAVLNCVHIVMKLCLLTCISSFSS